MAHVVFRRIADGSTAFAGVRWKGGNVNDTWCKSEFGYRGPSNATAITINGCGRRATPGSDSSSSLLHELGHALGLVHEHQRSDRDAFVTYDASCVNMPGLRSKSTDFGIDGLNLGPYERESIMHYGSYAFSKRNAPDFSPQSVVLDSNGDIVLDIGTQFEVGTTSPIMQQAFDPDGPVFNWFSTAFRFKAEYDDGTHAATFEGYLGDNDPETEFELRPQKSGSSEFALLIRGNTFGTELPGPAVSDIENPANWTIVDDNDQAEPDCPALIRAGTDYSDADSVLGRHVFLHTPGTLSALWTMYGPGSDRNGVAAAGDRFGSGMAWGDFDGDGLLDLAVSDTSQGDVVIHRGLYAHTDGALSVTPWERLVIPAAAALAAGDFNADGYDDLVVGTPTPASAGGTPNGGGVVVIMGSDVGLEHGREPRSVTSELTDRGLESLDEPIASGLAPSIWTLASSQSAMLGDVGGLPIHRHARTAIPSSYTPTAGTDWNDMVIGGFPTSTTCAKGSTLTDLVELGGRVGATLHVADVNDDGVDDLMIGAPGGRSYLSGKVPGGADLLGHDDTGVVVVMVGAGALQTAPADDPLLPFDVLSPYTRSDHGLDRSLYYGSHQGSEFGQAITTGDVTGNGCVDIIVGAPNDFGLLGGGLETDGDHRGAGPFTNTPGRAWVFEGGKSGNVCSTPFAVGEVPNQNAGCLPRFRADTAYSEPTGDVDAEFGFALAFAQTAYGDPLVLVGAPGSDQTVQPTKIDAGAVWSVWPGFPSSSWQRIDQDATGAGGRVVAGSPVVDNEHFGWSLDYSNTEGLLVGAPGDMGGRGSVDWYELPSATSWLFEPSPDEPATMAQISGFRANEVLANHAFAEFGTQVLWIPWDLQASGAPSFVSTAPGAIEALPTVQTGAVIGVRNNGTLGGAPYSTLPGELLMVTR